MAIPTTIAQPPNGYALALILHILAGTGFVFLGYLAHELRTNTVPWLIPLAFAAAVIAIDWVAAFHGPFNLGYTGIVAAIAGTAIGVSITIAAFKPENKPPEPEASI